MEGGRILQAVEEQRLIEFPRRLGPVGCVRIFSIDWAGVLAMWFIFLVDAKGRFVRKLGLDRTLSGAAAFAAGFGSNSEGTAVVVPSGVRLWCDSPKTEPELILAQSSVAGTGESEDSGHWAKSAGDQLIAPELISAGCQSGKTQSIDSLSFFLECSEVKDGTVTDIELDRGEAIKWAETIWSHCDSTYLVSCRFSLADVVAAFGGPKRLAVALFDRLGLDAILEHGELVTDFAGQKPSQFNTP